MSVYVRGSRATQSVATGADTNSTSTVTTSHDTLETSTFFCEVRAASGTHATHVVTVQCSSDDSNWEDMATTITGTGTATVTDVGARYVRAKVTTAEGAASTCDIYTTAK